MFPVQRPGKSKRGDWELFFSFLFVPPKNGQYCPTNQKEKKKYVRHVRVDLYLTMNFAANRFNISDYEDRYTI